MFLFLIAVVSNAQEENNQQQKKRDFSNVKTKLTGRVLDNESDKPLESVNIQIYSMRDTNKLVKGTATGSDGTFELSGFRPGKYQLKISFIGYNTAVKNNLAFTPTEPEMALGDVRLKIGSEMVTAEIEVTAERNMMEMGVDKKVFNVEKDINSQSGTVTDVLKNIPSITVDSDGKISLRGSGNVKILLNGKPSGLLTSDPNAVLDQIPANTVERIEVINNPSAKYDPEGMAGIINIVLKKSASEKTGYNYNLNLNAGTGDKYNIATGLAFKTRNMNIYGNYSLRIGHMGFNGDNSRTNFLSDSLYYTTGYSNMTNKMLGHIGTLGLDYDLSKDAFLGLSLSYSNRDRDRNEIGSTKNFSREGNPNNFYNVNNDEDESSQGVDANVNFRQKFAKKFQELNASFQYSHSFEKSIQHNNTFYQDIYGNPSSLDPTRFNDYTNEKFDSYIIQADYTHPLKEDEEVSYKLKSKFEAGMKSMIRRTDNYYRAENYDYLINQFVEDPLLKNNFLYNEQIHALYATFENNYKKFGYQIGLRVEQSFTKSEQMETGKNFENNYFSFFPSLFLKQGLTNTLEAQVSFTRRINRPRLGALNPFVDRSDPLNLRVGNPYLKPEYINGVEVGLVKYLSTFALTGSTFYRLTTDVITRYATIDSNGIATMSQANLSQAKTFGVELIGTGSLLKWWFVNASASYFRTDLTGNINGDLDNSGYSWTAKFVSNMSLPKILDIQISYFYQGKNVSAQGYNDPMQSCDIAVKKDFMNKRISVGFRVSDVFNTQKFVVHNTTTTYNADVYRKRDSRALFLTFNYKIGTDEKKPKREKKKEDNNQDQDIEY
ncbi:MAG: TonB-dependent receptor [Bacteroidetes bacterium]|nr:TonB-dependent receptor [Bacteroidota bacterium]